MAGLIQAGDIPQAEKYIAAAWGLCEFTEIGDHLGQIYEKEGRKTDSILQYEITLGSLTRCPKRVLASPRCFRQAPTLTLESRVKLRRSAGEEIEFPNLHKIDANGEVWILLKPGPTVEAVQFISGGDAMKATAPDLRAGRFPDTFPDSTAVTLLRRAWLMCSTYTHECLIGLVAVGDSALLREVAAFRAPRFISMNSPRND